MGQTWVITAPRANEVLNFGGKLGEILFNGSAESLVKLLAMPVRPDNSIEQSIQRWKNQRIQSCKDKREAGVIAKPLLLNLLIELHNLVFNDLDIKDVLNLSLTNRYFWSIGRKHIQTYFMLFLGPWADENIICIE
ncbi:hypothetical protein K469DRAFT_576005 [Zopfia rhizophila CBS 207.26]|uniref:F-box domain-containing protein n=1 Tax=Zopfia rhizophila CBS 207.26 TaxID=1314779 RepID=A0A6A6E142_9PEZI|nr:hypothetical protein K469DRAFT_576005 [Zopfia rhizophila CBS 207.26]